MVTNKEISAGAVSKKYWVLLDQSCHFCDALMLDLAKFCNGKKPSSKKIGFFMVGINQKLINKKLGVFNKSYDVYLGSTNEFFNAYNLQGSPSLLLKASKKSILGQDKIVQKLKKDKSFCKGAS